MKEYETVAIVIPEAVFKFGNEEFKIRQMPTEEMFNYWKAQRIETEKTREDLRKRIAIEGAIPPEEVLIITYKYAEKNVAHLFREKLDQILKIESLSEEEKELIRLQWVRDNIKFQAELNKVVDTQDELNQTELIAKKAISLLGEEIVYPWRRPLSS